MGGAFVGFGVPGLPPPSLPRKGGGADRGYGEIGAGASIETPSLAGRIGERVSPRLSAI